MNYYTKEIIETSVAANNLLGALAYYEPESVVREKAYVLCSLVKELVNAVRDLQEKLENLAPEDNYYEDLEASEEYMESETEEQHEEQQDKTTPQ